MVVHRRLLTPQLRHILEGAHRHIRVLHKILHSKCILLNLRRIHTKAKVLLCSLSLPMPHNDRCLRLHILLITPRPQQCRPPCRKHWQACQTNRKSEFPAMCYIRSTEILPQPQNLIMRVASMTPDEIQRLPPVERANIIQLVSKFFDPLFPSF